MLRLTRSRLARSAAVALLGAALAVPALADHGRDWDDDGDRYRPNPAHRHGPSCDVAWNRGHYRVAPGHGGHPGWHSKGAPNHWAPRGSHDGQRGFHGYGRFGCQPCGRRWDSRSSFYQHLNRQHHVAPHWAPRVLVEVGWGWLFAG